MSKLICVCCGGHLFEVNRGLVYRYFNCRSCNYWTSRSLNYEFPSFDYSAYSIGNPDYINDWDARVEEARKIMHFKFSLVKTRPPGVFLDIGCSEGFYVAAAAKLGWVAKGVELEGPRIAHAKKRGLDVSGFNDFSLEDGSVDFILLRHVIEHIPDFIDALNSASKLLRKGGILCVETPNQAGMKTRLARRKLIGDRFLGHVYPPTHIHGFEVKTYEMIAKKMDIDSIRTVTYSPADSNWVFASNYLEGLGKKVAHRLFSLLGGGENIAAFYRKNY